MGRTKLKKTVKSNHRSLPKRICVLDIETTELVGETPLASDLAIVGVREWRRKGVSYAPATYVCFSPHEFVPKSKRMDALKTYLEDFEGPIVGHNIFDFDLRQLSLHIDVKKIIPKIVDTMALLLPYNDGHHWSLSLDNLCRRNFNKTKLASGKKAPQLWKSKRYSELQAYNKRDLELTKALWLHLARRKNLVTRFDYHPKGDQEFSIKLSLKDVEHTNGNRTYLSANTVLEAYKANEKLFVHKPYKSAFSRLKELEELLSDAKDNEIEEVMYHWRGCEKCKCTNFYLASIQRGFSDYQIAKCNSCGESSGEVRADLGLDTIGAFQIALESGSSQGFLPPILKKHIKEHFKNEMKRLKIILRYGDCEICGSESNRSVSPSEQYQNPANDRTICRTCLTSGFWQFEMK